MIYQKPTRTVTGAYTTADTDNGCRIICNSASAFEVTLHTATGRYNFDLEFDNIGAGTVTVGGQTIDQYGHAHIGCDGTDWIVTVSGGGSGGAVDSVNGETGTVVLDAADIDITDSGDHFTATDVEGALAELFTSGSDGKAALETAIETKGGTVDKAGAIATFAELEDGIDSIPSSGATYQSKTVTPDAAGQTVTPDTGYDALTQVTINGDADLVAENIKLGITIFGITGTYTGGSTPSYSKITGVTATASSEYSSSFLASYAVDGDTTTRWASLNKTGTQYIQFDLGAARTLGKIRAMCGSTYATEVFNINVSTNGTDWTSIADAAIIAGDTWKDFYTPPASCRYVKLIMISTANSSFYEMKEFEAYAYE